MTQCSMNTRSFIFFTRILARALISSLIFRGLFYWCFIGHNFGDYKNPLLVRALLHSVLSVTILETTKTAHPNTKPDSQFYRSQFWRLQKPLGLTKNFFGEFYRSQFWRLQKLLQELKQAGTSFIGHNFGDYKNLSFRTSTSCCVLSVTILETTKTSNGIS